MLGAPLLEIVSTLRRPWKYAALILRTISSLAEHRPAILFVQCPSVVLGMLSVALRPFLRYRLVLDLHNECVEPFNYGGAAYHGVLRWLWRSGDALIVSNDALARMIERPAARVYVLPDRVPPLTRNGDAPSRTEPLVVFICTFAPDEPYLAVLEAARQLQEIAVAVTGNFTKASDIHDVPANVRLCGFLPEHEYQALIAGADVLVDLTDMENCLVCGAYEAVALRKPLVTSDTAALRAYFSRGTVYTQHTPEAIASAIAAAVARRPELAAEMSVLGDELDARWNDLFAVFSRSLERGF